MYIDTTLNLHANLFRNNGENAKKKQACYKKQTLTHCYKKGTRE